MPKDRKKTNSRQVRKRLFILCEGEKTELNYFKKLIQSKKLRGKPVKLKVISTEKNTARELVEEAAKTKELPKDEAWVVFDKDGYTKHEEAFNKAKSHDVRVAFSSISFEFWLLVHFEFTTRAFNKSKEIIKSLKKYFDYKKNDERLYELLKNNTENAAEHALRIREFQEETNPGVRIHALNPYTNVDELIFSINQITREYE